MMSSFIMSLMLTSTSIALLSYTPLQLGLCILIMALLTALLFAMNLSIWMSFLIFLIYIGGMLIMFSYFIATSPNMKISFMFMFLMTLFLTPTFFIILNLNFLKLTPEYSNQWSESTTFYNMYHMPTLTLMALTLLITLVIIVKLSNTSKGPLRPFN